MERLVYTVAEVAELVQVNKVTIFAHIKEGRLRATKTSKKFGAYRITNNALKKYIATYESQETEEASPAEAV